MKLIKTGMKIGVLWFVAKTTEQFISAAAEAIAKHTTVKIEGRPDDAEKKEEAAEE